MKKYIFVALALSSLVVNAQDTVKENMSCYMFMPYEKIVSCVLTNGCPSGHITEQYYGDTNDSIIVYGVALTTSAWPVEEERINDNVTMTPTVMLFNGNPYTASFVDSANVFNTLKECLFSYQVTFGEEVVVPCYEFYFDTPHPFCLPSDTFYVSFYMPMERITNLMNWYRNLNSSGGSPWWPMPYFAKVDPPTSNLRGWVYNDEFHTHSINSPMCSSWGMLFPIVKPRCVAPHIQLVGCEGSTATINWWQAEAGENYQLSLGTYGSNPDSGLMTTTVDTFHTVTDLQPDVIYQAWVRKACHYTTAGYDTMVWSDWSQPATFRIGTGQGVGAVEEDATFSLAPNPTHGSVVLTLAEAAEGAELTLCDLGGRELRREQVRGTIHSLDVSALPSGVYLLKLTTPQGVAIRRLLVE